MALNYKSSLVRYRRYLAAAESDPVWKASLFVILSLLLLLFMILFAIRPTLITIAGLVSDIKEHQILSNRLSEKIDLVRDASDLLSQQRDNLPLLDEGLPTKPEWNEWVLMVEELAKANGIVLENVIAGPVTVEGKQVLTPAEKQSTTEMVELPKGVTPIPFNVIVKGDYEKLSQFASLIERSRRIALVTNITTARNKDGDIVTTITGVIGYMMETQKK